MFLAWFYRVCRLGRDQDPHTEQERYDYLRKLVKRVNKSGRVAIEVHGRDNLPAADGFIMFPNHQGLFDVLAVIEGCPRPFGVVIKKEAADIILVKQVVRLLRRDFHRPAGYQELFRGDQSDDRRGQEREKLSDLSRGDQIQKGE